MRAWIYNFTTFVYDVRSREFDVKLARLYASSSSSRVEVLERSSTSTSARVLECEGSDLRVKLEYECSSFTH